MLPLIYKKKLTFFLLLITICVLFGFSESILTETDKTESSADTAIRTNPNIHKLKSTSIDDLYNVSFEPNKLERMTASITERLKDILKEFNNVLASSVDYDFANNQVNIVL